MKLQIKLAGPIFVPKTGGTGYDVQRIGEHHAVFTVGNVSVAFDGRNNWRGDAEYEGEVIELSEYKDCPVRLGTVDYPKVGRDPAEILLCVLAADLGYTVTRID